jgi:hypothetical protein
MQCDAALLQRASSTNLNSLRIFPQVSDDFFDAATVTQMDQFDPHAHNDATHDVDGLIVPVKLDGPSHKAHFVGRLLLVRVS